MVISDSNEVRGLSAVARRRSDSGFRYLGSDVQVQELTVATGAVFDRLFLQLIIVHYRGVIEMSDTELAGGDNPAIKASQTAEMQQLLGAI